mmetsp:Transcript_38229/g.92211  ORF Transcript_38229/g.92211 Transcript_38229/m.92211 type:complete len:86 (-) Transcript_38229:185-442(-)
MPILLPLLPYRRAYHRGLLRDYRALLGGGLAGSDLTDEIAELQRHGYIIQRGRRIKLKLGGPREGFFVSAFPLSGSDFLYLDRDV